MGIRAVILLRYKGMKKKCRSYNVSSCLFLLLEILLAFDFTTAVMVYKFISLADLGDHKSCISSI